jgi:hypothetical protein
MKHGEWKIDRIRGHAGDGDWMQINVTYKLAEKMALMSRVLFLHDF